MEISSAGAGQATVAGGGGDAWVELAGEQRALFQPEGAGQIHFEAKAYFVSFIGFADLQGAGVFVVERTGVLSVHG